MVNLGSGDHRIGGIGGRRMIDTMRRTVPGKVLTNTVAEIDLDMDGLKLGGIKMANGGLINSNGSGANIGLGRIKDSMRLAVERLRTLSKGRAQLRTFCRIMMRRRPLPWRPRPWGVLTITCIDCTQFFGNRVHSSIWLGARIIDAMCGSIPIRMNVDKPLKHAFQAQ